MLPVSRLTTDSVDRHCGANTYQASSESAVASDHDCAISGASEPATSLPPDSAYTVPSAPTATSRAAMPGTSAMQICQPKPIGAKITDSARPSMPATL